MSIRTVLMTLLLFSILSVVPASGQFLQSELLHD